MRYLLFLSLSIFIFSFSACNQNEKAQKNNEDAARIINASTSGMISSDEIIKVVFTETMADAKELGKTLKTEVLTFKPGIKGQAMWRDGQTLVFKPTGKLPLKQRYTARLDLKTLPASKDLSDLESFSFEFQTAGRELEFFDADFELFKENDPKYLVWKGIVKFTESVELKQVQKAAQLLLFKSADQKKVQTLKLSWTAEDNQKVFTFESAPLKRTSKTQLLTFELAKNPLDISETFIKEIKIPVNKKLTVTDIRVQSNQQKPQVLLTFSDPLLANQDLRGLIQVEPTSSLSLKITGNKVLVQADFEHGQTYKIIVKPGIRSKWATKTETELKEEVLLEDLLPEISFSDNGVFLPSSNQHKILFQTVNVRCVDLKIIKVFESNLGHFLHLEKLNGKKDRNDNFHYNINHVGIDVVKKELDIGEERNRRLQHEIDIKNLLKEDDAGLFLIEITFKREDMIYETSDTDLRYNRRRDYYNDPASHGYLYRHGRIIKPIIMSDIGLTHKNAGKDHYVFVNDIVQAKPLPGANISLYSFQNQLLAEGRSNADGMVQFSNIEDRIFYIAAEKKGQRSVIKPGEMRWNTSTFNTEGQEISNAGIRAFTYTERGVYRPGDAINLALILRNAQNTFPDNHPVTLNLKNPLRQNVFQKTLKNGKDGFYHFSFSTGVNDITGTYRAEIKAGSQTFYHDIKVETIVPERLKIDVTAPQKIAISSNRQLKLFIKSSYLMGNPASNLRAEIDIELQDTKRSFKVYRDYIFTNPSREFRPQKKQVYHGLLDEAGQKKVLWNVPALKQVPSAIKAILTTKVFEKGGRSAQRSNTIAIDPYDYYVGLKKPKMRWGSVRTGTEIKIPLVLLDSTGTARAGRTLHYRIYKNDHYWWYEYSSNDRYQLRFKRDRNTELVSEGSVLSGNGPVNLNFSAETRGNYFVEVQDSDDSGHSSGFFIRAYSWGSQQDLGKNAGVLTLQVDKKLYHPGEEARITFPVPEQATILLTIEKGTKILSSKWLNVNKQNNEYSLQIPISEKMLPNAYASVSVIQPQTQVTNDRPIRMYGIIPLNVELASTHQNLQIEMADELQAGEPFKVKVQTKDKKATQLTIAVVDEGLLSLTRFSTPDPWKSFFSKQRLQIATSDLYNQVIGVNRGDIFRTFSIGGGLSAAETYRQSQLAPEKKRFEPVCLFSGIIETDGNGRTEVEFQMPEYIGAVRVMVVSANENRYGNAEKTVPVKKPVMLLPTVPRALGPGDLFTLPVTVFYTEDKPGNVQITLKTNGPVEISGHTQKQLSFTKAGDQDISFILKAKQEVGTADIILHIRSGNYKDVIKTLLPVRPSSPRITEYQNKVTQPGQRISFLVPDKGLSGSNKARLHIRRRPNIQLTRRILDLIRYPYGCIEQTVSAVFPQLYIQDFIPKSRAAQRDIDKDINEAIYRLGKFQRSSGGFSYWPGRSEESVWGTLYAVHFMVEAKQAGYHVPENLLTKTLPFIKKQLRISSDWELLEKVYAIYVLALAGEAPFGSMNLLRENYFSKMNDTERWLLAASYALSGNKSTAAKLIHKTGVKVGAYKHFSRTFGSAYRDKALILEQLIRFERWEQAEALANEIAEALSSQTWYSTQSSGFMLIALGKYLRAVEGDDDQPKIMSGKIIYPDGKQEAFHTDQISYSFAIENDFGKEVFVEIDKQTTVNKVFAELEWSGLPVQYTGTNEAKNIKLELKYLDEDGIPMNPVSIAQGSSFWIHFRISRARNIQHRITELALTQVLPAGWEIDNYLLLEEKRPTWMRKWHTGREQYRDFRDDRVMWFFDLGQQPVDFVVKINAVTKGNFFLPPTLVEAMYNNGYRAQKAGQQVQVK